MHLLLSLPLKPPCWRFLWTLWSTQFYKHLNQACSVGVISVKILPFDSVQGDWVRNAQVSWMQSL
jgi:hypothetical protein